MICYIKTTKDTNERKKDNTNKINGSHNFEMKNEVANNSHTLGSQSATDVYIYIYIYFSLSITNVGVLTCKATRKTLHKSQNDRIKKDLK